MPRRNEFGQPIGPDLDGWSPPEFPDPTILRGRYVELDPLTQSHATPLFEVLSPAPPSMWTYMAMGPFPDVGSLSAEIAKMRSHRDRQPFAIVVDGAATGFASYLRIDAAAGVVEIGSIAFSPPLQGTRAATESIFLLINHVFGLGYRRCEWKCDDLNEPSRRAAERFGFRFEGTFLQATHYKGRSRDTAWYSITDREWPPLRQSFQAWLAPDNFDGAGHQVRRLEEMRR